MFLPPSIPPSRNSIGIGGRWVGQSGIRSYRTTPALRVWWISHITAAGFNPRWQTVGHRDKLVGEHGFDRLAVEEPVNLREILNFILVGLHSQITGTRLQGVTPPGAAGGTPLKKKHLFELE